MYVAAATLVLTLHLAFVLWVIFGALLTRGRPVLRWMHITSLVWGLLIEILPWTCPLTFAENWLEQRTSYIAPYKGPFLLHYLDALVYPDIPPLLLTAAAGVVVLINVTVYWRRARRPRGKVTQCQRRTF
jgi:hypothetical protein